jgi:hypothetical protein
MLGVYGSSKFVSARSVVANTGALSPNVAASNVLVSATYTPSTFSPFINGSTETTLAGTTLAATGLYVGGPTNYFSGSISEILVYSATLTSTQRQSIEGYLAWKWGLQVQTPVAPVSTPLSISGCALWLDAADSSTITIATGVSQWNDKSGNGYNFTQSTTTLQPTRTGNYLNFSNNYYLNIPAAFMNNYATWSLFFAINPISSSNWIMLKQHDGINTMNGLGITLNNTAGGQPGTGTTGYLYWRSYNAGSQAVSSTVMTTSTVQLYSLVFDGTSLYMYINGTLNSTTVGTFATLNDTSPTGYLLGGFLQNSVLQISNVTNFQLGEMLSYSSNLATTNRQSVENYLMGKWGIKPSLPAIHPFYSLPAFSRRFSPIDIPGCALWLDAADATTFTLNGSTVASWRDKSGNGYSVGQSTASNQPTYTTGLLNGLAGVQLSPTTYLYQPGSNMPIYASASKLTVFIVAKNATSTSVGNGWNIVNTMWFNNVNNATTRYHFSFAEGNTNGVRLYANGSTIGQTTAIPLGSNALIGFTISSTGNSINVNGTLTTYTGTSSTSAADSTWFMFGDARGTFVSDVNVYEFVGFNTDLTTTQRQQVEGYLAAKWGLLSSVVSGHPFKSIPPSTSQPPQFQEVTPGNWTYDWQPYLQRLAAANSSGVTVTTSNITGGATFTSYGWVGGVLAPNGNIYFAPLVATNIFVLNPTTDVTSNLTGGATYTTNGWTGGVLAPNGNIYFCPHWATNILVLNPTTGVTSNLTGGATYPGGNSGAWFGGVLAPNGNIYFCPYNAANILVLNPTTGVTSNLTGGATNISGRVGGVLAPNGNIYFCGASDILVLNPTTGVTSNLTGGATFVASGWGGGVLAPNGNIYFCPNSASNILVLNPTTGVTSNLTGGATYTTPNGWSGGGLLAPNGNIYFIPYGATNVLVLNPTTAVTSNLTGGATYPSAGSGAWYGGVLAPNGKIYAAPSFTTNILKINFAGLSQLPSSNYCLSAWTNKF